MSEVIELPTSILYMYREQSYPGRCVLAHKKHKYKLTDLTRKEAAEFFDEVRLCAEVIDELYGPDKINYLILGDVSPHLHIHIVPKYKDGPDWGKVFQISPNPAHYIDKKLLEQQILLLKQTFGNR